MKNILVTGGAGFIGSKLCEKLSENINTKVYSLDNYFTGTTKNHVNNVQYINASTSDITKTILNDINFDIIYHLGEYSRVEQSFDDYELVWKYNIIGTHEIVDFAIKKSAKLIYAASSSNFATPDQNYIQSPYSWSKETNSNYINKCSQWHGLNYAIVYFYNVYGKGEINTGKYSTLIAKYIECMKNGESLPVVSPGNQKRNFTHINDIVKGIVMIAEHGYGDGYEIGNEKEYSIIDIAKMFGGKYHFVPERKGNRLSSKINTSKMYNLGWKPEFELVDYINKARNNKWII